MEFVCEKRVAGSGCTRAAARPKTSIFGATTQAWKISLAPINVYGARLKSMLSNEKRTKKKALRQQGLVSSRRSPAVLRE
jgi:hypothetical protein